MLLRILVFVGVLAVVAVPALLTSKRGVRLTLVALLLGASIIFGIIVPGVELRAAVSQVRTVELTGPITLEQLREILLNGLRRGTAMQVALCFWLAVLSVVPARSRKESASQGTELAASPRDPGAV